MSDFRISKVDRDALLEKGKDETSDERMAVMPDDLDLIKVRAEILSLVDQLKQNGRYKGSPEFSIFRYEKNVHIYPSNDDARAFLSAKYFIDLPINYIIYNHEKDKEDPLIR